MSNEKHVINVSQEHRTNVLSSNPGGSTVTVHYVDRIKIYDNIHYPKAYVNKLENNPKDPIVKVEVNGNVVNF